MNENIMNENIPSDLYVLEIGTKEVKRDCKEKESFESIEEYNDYKQVQVYKENVYHLNDALKTAFNEEHKEQLQMQIDDYEKSINKLCDKWIQKDKDKAVEAQKALKLEELEEIARDNIKREIEELEQLRAITNLELKELKEIKKEIEEYKLFLIESENKKDSFAKMIINCFTR